LDKPRGRKPRRMWQRMSKARLLWRLGVAAAQVQRVGAHVDGCEWSGTNVRAEALTSRMPLQGARPCRCIRVGARQHKSTPHRLAMNKGRCLLEQGRRANAHDGGARIAGRSRRTISTMSNGLPQCRQTKAGARTAGSPVGNATLACSAMRAIARQSRRLPLASSP
jgi:hypothetical protein